MADDGLLSCWPVWEGRVKLYIALLRSLTLLLVQRKYERGISHTRWGISYKGRKKYIDLETVLTLLKDIEEHCLQQSVRG
jgi:hypothetical protein